MTIMLQLHRLQRVPPAQHSLVWTNQAREPEQPHRHTGTLSNSAGTRYTLQQCRYQAHFTSVQVPGIFSNSAGTRHLFKGACTKVPFPTVRLPPKLFYRVVTRWFFNRPVFSYLFKSVVTKYLFLSKYFTYLKV